MIGLVKVYQEHKRDIEHFIIDNIHNNGITTLENSSLEGFFKTFKSLQLLYLTDENYQQSSPNFSRISTDISRINTNRGYIFKKRILNEDGEYISSPYICSKSGNLILTVIKKIEEKYLVMDFNLVELLEELGFVTHALFFTKFNKFIYGLIGYGLAFLSSILIFYSIVSFYDYFMDSISLIDASFKSIISLTLGLAVFDLGKNLLEHEVIYKGNNPNQKNDSKMFIKFIISIITALSIEALMLVLKISLTKEYHDLVYAVYLIGGVSFMIATLGFFYSFSKKENERTF
jgi:hypothetical protein